jgi:hypothetical protein
MAEVKVKKPESSGPFKRYNYNRLQQKKGNQETKFDGRYDNIKGFVFNCADGKQADRYNTTIREITTYAGITNDYGGDIIWSIKNEKKYVPIKPARWARQQLLPTNKSGRGRSMNMCDTRPS